ncbi:MAG: DUF3099 domain-containing protein [Microbacteriaceae bacterium]|nr:DUF3099 domain-containing protein [Microbacteriaceae bacterium]
MGRPMSITALPVSADDDRRRRFISYTVMMCIRVACVIACLFVTGWWQLLCLLGAVVLPYLAVTVANVARTRQSEEPETVGPLELPESWRE